MKTKKLPYGPVNVEFFQKVKQHILEEPRRFNMDDWFINCSFSPHFVPLEETPPCGTVACIAGWAVALNHLKTHKTLRTFKLNSLNVEDTAAYLLGLQPQAKVNDSFYKPFHVADWPVRFKNRYLKAETPTGRARAAADFIDYVCGL